MSDFDKCKNCGDYDFLDRHKCQPEWEAIYIDYHEEDDPGKAFGHSPKTAVLSFAEKHFSDWDYPEEIEIWVRKPGETEWQKFYVEVEQVPSFSATEIKGGEK